MTQQKRNTQSSIFLEYKPYLDLRFIIDDWDELLHVYFGDLETNVDSADICVI